jgi:hypothetical protein
MVSEHSFNNSTDVGIRVDRINDPDVAAGGDAKECGAHDRILLVKPLPRTLSGEEFPGKPERSPFVGEE